MKLFLLVFIFVFDSFCLLANTTSGILHIYFNSSKDSSRNKTKNFKAKNETFHSLSFLLNDHLNKPILDTFNITSLNLGNDSTLVLAKDFPMPVDENSYFENELYKNRLDSLQKNIPLSYNESVQSYINLYVYKRRALIERLLGEGKYYFPIFEKALASAGVPQELKYLPIIESALNPFAVSKMGATGPWQFMPGTGKDYGLMINKNVDERKDPSRSTEAAAHYLKDMYGRYGDWLLVIASYNCGKGNVDKAIRRSGGTHDFWSIQQFLPRETRTYVPAFIAATYIMNYAPHHGMRLRESSFNIYPDTIPITQTVSLSAIAKNLCISNDEIKRLNPAYKKGLVFGSISSPIQILVPGKSGGQIEGQNNLANEALLSQLKLNPEYFTHVSSDYSKGSEHSFFMSRLIHHRVRSGETLLLIADRYSCEVKELKSWNHLRTARLVPGQKLKVKQSVEVKASKSTTNRYARIKSSLKTSHYKVRRGDTLELIANRFNTSVNSIKGMNRLHSNLVKTGQSLKVTNRI